MRSAVTISRRRLLALGTVLPTAALGLTACGQSGTTLERAQRERVLRVGISGDRPYCYVDAGGHVTGAHPEVARAVLARMGIGGIEAVQMRFDQLIGGLRKGQFDLVTAGMVINPDRCAQVAFTRPDIVVPPALLVPEGNPDGLRSLDDVRQAGLRIAAQSGAVELGYARAAGIINDHLEVVGAERQVFDAVIDKKAQVGVMSAIAMRDALRHNPGSGLESTGPIVAYIGGKRAVSAAGFAMRVEDRDLLARFDSELAALQAEGKWLPITKPFGFTTDNLPPRDLTTESLCKP